MEVEYNSANDNAMAATSATSAVMWYLSLMNLINTIRTCSITSVSTTCPINSSIFFLSLWRFQCFFFVTNLHAFNRNRVFLIQNYRNFKVILE